MIHKPIQIKSLSLSFPHKICFEDFSTQIIYGSRIAIIGRNGSGKTTLLKILQSFFEATEGDITVPDDVIFGYVPQIIDEFTSLSGGQRLNKAITKALSVGPNILLLDEPTNHLDRYNRKSLMRMLKSYVGTLIVVSHDTELLRNCIDTFWHIDNGKIHVFSGSYDDYIREVQGSKSAIEEELSRLGRQKKDMHKRLMKEQERISKRKASGLKKMENKRWLKSTGDLKAMKAEKSQGGKLKAIDHKKQNLIEQLSSLYVPEIIIPKFSLSSADIGDRTLVSISNGSIRYKDGDFVLSNINLFLNSKSRMAITGDNGSGKSTLAKAILGDPGVIKTGDWYVPKLQNIFYLDQHYSTLIASKSVLDSISELVPSWSHAEVRRHLNDFLFRKNEEVNALVSQLSGGEKARLSLAQIAAKTPQLLILDEITNNLDLETKGHVTSVLKNYPGAIIIISHDEDFLRDIEVGEYYNCIIGVEV